MTASCPTLHVPPATRLEALCHALRQAGLVIDGRYRRDGLNLLPIDRPTTTAALNRAASSTRRAAS